MASGLWGHLSRKMIITKTEDELIENDMDAGITEKHKYTITDEFVNAKVISFVVMNTHIQQT